MYCHRLNHEAWVDLQSVRPFTLNDVMNTGSVDKVALWVEDDPDSATEPCEGYQEEEEGSLESEAETESIHQSVVSEGGTEWMERTKWTEETEETDSLASETGAESSGWETASEEPE